MSIGEDDRKIRILTAICENPGWHPTAQSSSTDRILNELKTEGWIIPRLDGWEASPLAVQCYPNFYTDIEGKICQTEAPPPKRDELDRPGYERPAPEPASENPWETTHTLSKLVVGEKQEIRVAIDIDGLKGGVSLVNARPDGQRVEVEITARIRRVQ